MISPAKGVLLIANPFLKDPHFHRTVILICENEVNGAFGFVLNKQFHQNLTELIPGLQDLNLPVYKGGPVQGDSLHFLHQYPNLISGGQEVADGIFWGGNFESLLIHLKNKDVRKEKIRFFIGYSGWTEGQLDNEMTEGSWLTVEATRKLVFETPPENTWKESLNYLGGEYKMLINYPTDPQLN